MFAQGDPQTALAFGSDCEQFEFADSRQQRLFPEASRVGVTRVDRSILVHAQAFATRLFATFPWLGKARAERRTGLTEMVDMPHGVRSHSAKVVSSVAPFLDPTDPMTTLSADSDSAC